jgi:hypothetical protein
MMIECMTIFFDDDDWNCYANQQKTMWVIFEKLWLLKWNAAQVKLPSPHNGKMSSLISIPRRRSFQWLIHLSHYYFIYFDVTFLFNVLSWFSWCFISHNIVTFAFIDRTTSYIWFYPKQSEFSLVVVNYS